MKRYILKNRKLSWPIEILRKSISFMSIFVVSKMCFGGASFPSFLVNLNFPLCPFLKACLRCHVTFCYYLNVQLIAITHILLAICSCYRTENATSYGLIMHFLLGGWSLMASAKIHCDCLDQGLYF